MSMAGLNISGKAAKESSSIEAVDLGVKLQSSKLLPCKKMTVHHDNRYRPLPPYGNGCREVDTVGLAGNNNNRPATSYLYDVFGSSDSGSCAAVASSAAAVGVRILRPFDISSTATSTAETAFKSPGGMMASLEFPFTSAQWKELERQAVICKYMTASVPVPPDLLSPITGSPSVPVASHSALGGGASNLRFSSRGDLEPGRCRRTDGKKWRCSRDVAPDQKYCERHMYRGRPRSRKPVELPNKKTLHSQTEAAPSSSSTIHNENASPPSQFVGTLAQRFEENHATCFVDKPNEKAAIFCPVTSVSSYKEPRDWDWIVNEQLIPLASSDQQWHHFMQIGKTTASSFSNAANSFVLNQNYYKEPVKLNSYANFSAAEDQRRTSCHLFRNSEIVTLEKSPEGTPTGFIDAWSSGVSDGQNANSGTETSVPSNGKHPLSSSLSLSMGVNNKKDEEMGPIHMGLRVTESDQNHEYASISHLSSWLPPASWATSTPGGPLAEVLRPSNTVTAAMEGSSNQSSPLVRNGTSCSPPVTAVSSPSGVLQRALASLSDSSGSSSPTLASSRARPEIGLMWLKGN